MSSDFPEGYYAHSWGWVARLGWGAIAEFAGELPHPAVGEDGVVHRVQYL